MPTPDLDESPLVEATTSIDKIICERHTLRFASTMRIEVFRAAIMIKMFRIRRILK